MPDEKEKGEKPLLKFVEVTPYFLSAPYSYPYSMSDVLVLEKETCIRVETKSNTSLLMNHLVTAKPIVN